MNFCDLNFIKGRCQLDYNYYVLSFEQIEDTSVYECSVFNRVKLPVDLPGVKTEEIKNNKWVKLKLTELDIEVMIKKFWAITGIKKPKQLKEREFYKNLF